MQPDLARIRNGKMSYILSEPYAAFYVEYLEYERPGMKERSYCRHKRMILSFLRWLEGEKLLPQDVKVVHAVKFKTDMSRRVNRNGSEISAGTLCNYIKAARRFYKWLLEREAVKTNPFLEVDYPRIPEHISRNVLTESQMNRLLERLKCFNGARTKKESARLYVCHVLSELMYSTGLRIEEAASLVPGDINLALRHVHVRSGKGGKSRTAFLSEYASEVLRLYLERGKKRADMILYGEVRETVFSGVQDSVMQMLNARLRKICLELGLPVITSHGFRHSLGTHLLRSGCDMRHIQVILGHDKLSSTQIYTKVYADDLKDSIDKYHPRQWIKSGEDRNETGSPEAVHS